MTSRKNHAIMETKMDNVVEVRIGQEWYFYESSKSFIVYKIEHTRYEYYDKELLKEEIIIHLRSQENSVISRGPFDFTEDKCKLIANNQANVYVDIKVIPVKIKTRLEKIED